MAGIYIHIPFCKQKCNYCNFYSLASVKYRDVFVDALLKEMEIQKDYLSGEHIETVYFGGGTPSLLDAGEIDKIIERLSKYHRIISSPEVTIEANPDDISRQKIKELLHTPVNRFSIGIQSFFDDDLNYLNRVHSGSEAEKSVISVLDAGYKNVTIDLIYGIPTLTDDKWGKNIEKFLNFQIPHLSSYALTVEPQTALDVLIRKGKMENVDEEKAVRHFKILMDAMKNENYIHYEISNFAKEGFYSKHNTSYWQGKKYLGLGPSAHSFDGNSRRWNIANLNKYIEGMKKGGKIVEQEILTLEQKYNEYVMTSLRTVWGTDIKYIEDTFGKNITSHYIKEIRKHINAKNVICNNGIYRLTKKGKLFADAIASDIFYIG